MKPVEPAYIEPANMDVAFPALSGTTSSSSKKATKGPPTKPLPPSPWNSGMQPPMQQNIPVNQGDMSNIPVAPAWFPHQDPSFTPFCLPAHNQPQAYYGEGGGYDYGDGAYGYGNNGYYHEDGAYYDSMGAQGGEIPAPPMPPQSFNVGAKEFVPGGF